MKYSENAEATGAAGGAAGDDACRGEVALLEFQAATFEDGAIFAVVHPVEGGKPILFDLLLKDEGGEEIDESLEFLADLFIAMGFDGVPDFGHELIGKPFLGYVRSGKLLKAYTSTGKADFRFALGQVVEHASSGRRGMVIDRQRTTKGRDIYTTEVLDPPVSLSDKPHRMTLGDGLVAAET